MKTPLELVYRHMSAAQHLDERVRANVERVERLFGRLITCRVVIDAPHRRKAKGNRYDVHIEAHGPMGVFIVNAEPGDALAHSDALVAVRDAFDALERQLMRWKETHKGKPATHAAPLQGRVTELERDFGQLLLTDGRLVYFHRNSVANGAFAKLAIGEPVELSLDSAESEKGPQATFVKPISAQRLVDRRKSRGPS